MPIFKIKVEREEFPIRFDMGAWFAAQELWAVKKAAVPLHAIKLMREDKMRFAVEMAYCMTRTLDEPPTLKRIQRMEMPEVVDNAKQIVDALNHAITGGLPIKKGSASPKRPVADGGADGTGGGRTRSRRGSASSRRAS